MGRLGSLLGVLGALLGRSWGGLGPLQAFILEVFRLLGRLGSLLGGLGALSGRSWGGLGPLGAVLAQLGNEKALMFLVFFNTFWKTYVLSKHVHLGRSWAFLRPA